MLAGLYRYIDLRMVGDVLRGARPIWLLISVSVIALIAIVRALRFLWVAPAGALPGFGEALRLILAASAFNIFLPAKTGDLIKSYYVATRGGTSAGVALSIVVYERLCDVFGLVFWCLVGFVLGRPLVSGVPQAVWPVLGAIGTVCLLLVSSERVAGVLRDVVVRVLPHKRLRRLQNLAGGWPELLRVLRGRRLGVVLLSCGLWLTHLVQLWLFTVALTVDVPFAVCASLSALALMAGQMPFTIGGLGVRDVALVLLLRGYMSPAEAAAMGVLVSTRNFLPMLAGLPFVRRYLTGVVQEARRWRSLIGGPSPGQAAVGDDQRARP
jgi:uncharacterized protein (TIRG00374 family)